MSLLWTSEELIAATAGRPVGTMPDGVSGISIDTRSLVSGEAFFAIKGDRFDGHRFIGNAMKKGAGLAVVSEDKLVALGQYTLPLVVVDDVLKAMERLGKAARARSRASIIAVTGSVGKTTVKEMLRTVLGECGSVHASAASYNNHWGVPLTLCNMPPDVRYGVFEIGMNHPDEIRPLVKMVRPHIGIITTVAAAHLGAFSGIDEIARAKAEIFEGIVPGGFALLNRDNTKLPLLKRLAEKAGVEHILTFGEKRGADFALRKTDEKPEGQSIAARLREHECRFYLPVKGHHMAINAVCVAGAAILAGASFDKVLKAFSKVVPEKGRGAIHDVNRKGLRFRIIDESYNANPASMAAAIQVLGQSEKGRNGRHIAILGDMLELGAASPRLHELLFDDLLAGGIDLVFLVGDEMRHLESTFESSKSKSIAFGGRFDSIDEVEAKLTEQLQNGDVVMLKASNGLKFGALVEKLAGE